MFFVIAMALQLHAVLQRPICVRILLICGASRRVAYIVRNRTVARLCYDIKSSAGKPAPEGKEEHPNRIQRITAMFVVSCHGSQTS